MTMDRCHLDGKKKVSVWQHLTVVDEPGWMSWGCSMSLDEFGVRWRWVWMNELGLLDESRWIRSTMKMSLDESTKLDESGWMRRWDEDESRWIRSTMKMSLDESRKLDEMRWTPTRWMNFQHTMKMDESMNFDEMRWVEIRWRWGQDELKTDDDTMKMSQSVRWMSYRYDEMIDCDARRGFCSSRDDRFLTSECNIFIDHFKFTWDFADFV